MTAGMGSSLRCGLVVAMSLAACSPAATSPVVEDTSAQEEATKSVEQATESGPMVGVLVPELEVVLVASGFAKLQRLDLQVGDHVAEGDLIAQMDVRGDKSELVAATAAWRASKASLDRLALELEQAEASRSDVEQIQKFISKAEVRERQFAEKLASARKRSAGASLRQQRSKMDEASARIAEAELRAPFSGTVARRYADPGATLGTGEPVVQIISDTRLIRFAVPEAHSAGLVLGAVVTVRFVAEDVDMTTAVTTVAPEIDAGTRLIFAEARLKLDDTQRDLLRVGTVAEVRFAMPRS
ncbi:MAG: efflux RND transporter periplasmic adaptor subunit [Nannocystales bacterium]